MPQKSGACILWGDLPDGLAKVGDGGGNGNGGVEKNAHCDGGDVFENYLKPDQKGWSAID